MCANTGATLHLVQPLGFTLDDARVKRAGLDYHELARVQQHADLPSLPGDSSATPACSRSRRETGSATTDRAIARATPSCSGAETSGLPRELVAGWPTDRRIRLPMRTPATAASICRNAVAVVVFEAWRQLGYPGSA